MEDFLFALLGALFDIFDEFVLQMIFELPTEALGEVFNSEEQRNTVVPIFGLVVGGVAAGLLSAWLFPNRFIAARVVVPGASLLLAPVATGAAMHWLGRLLRHLERQPSCLATFWGGALFALLMALVRWGLVGLPR